MGRRLTAADVCAVTGYSRDELHALLRVLAPYAKERPAPRVAREFTATDLVVLSVTQMLESRFGLRRTAVAEIGEMLQLACSGPRPLDEDACLAVTVRPPQVERSAPGIAREGLLIPLAPIYDRIDTYLSYDPQLALRFGPSLVARKYA